MAERNRNQTDEKEVDTKSFVRRKKMRKGTQSCIECRRRKIRCIWPTGETVTCSPCSARGSQCKSQNDGVILSSDIGNLSLRERVARLESVLENVLHRLSSTSGQDGMHVECRQYESDTDDVRGIWDYHDSRAPFVSVLGDAELLSPAKAGHSPSSLDSNQNTVYTTPSSSFVATLTRNLSGADQSGLRKQKNEKICARLRSYLPQYDGMISRLESSGSWWCHFYRKTHSSSIVKESLSSYASRLYTSTDPVDLGVLVVAYARSTGQDGHLYSSVEQLIISDPTYSQTIQGLECILLLAKSYTDIGQPRRSWYLTRRGLDIAQLMGLYHKASQDRRSAIIWHSLYHNDRFASLLLGLPYGVNDAHFPHLVVSSTGDADFVPHLFTHKCASIAGKILDRNLTVGTNSYAATVDLDDQLSAMAADMPPEWWYVPRTLPQGEKEVDQIRTRLQQHFYFFQLKSYLHLPFLISASTSDPYQHSKLVCTEAARQMLKRFFVYHTEVNDEQLLECKTADFIGFTAAAILLIGLSKLEPRPRLELSEEDSRLVSRSKAIFHESEKKGCRIASQCHKALLLLASLGESATLVPGDVRIPIPYFGVIVRRHVKQKECAFTSDPNSLPAAPLSSTIPHAQLTTIKSTNENAIVNDSIDTTLSENVTMHATSSILDDMSWEVDEFGNLPSLDPTQWLNANNMDINQDWTMFFNDNAS